MTAQRWPVPASAARAGEGVRRQVEPEVPALAQVQNLLMLKRAAAEVQLAFAIRPQQQCPSRRHLDGA